MEGGIVQGNVESVAVFDSAIFHMIGGEISFQPIVVRDTGKAILDGGYWTAVRAFDQARVHVNGGIVGSTFSVRTYGESHAVLNGANLSFIADEQSTAVVNGGIYEVARATGNAEMLINGGGFAVAIEAAGNGIVRLRSLDIIGDGPLIAQDNGVMHIYGTGLKFDVIDDAGTPRNVITGHLADGDPFTERYRILDQGQIILHEVPEPSTSALLAIAAATFAFTCRRRLNSFPPRWRIGLVSGRRPRKSARAANSLAPAQD
jgi:hypothetical protein